MSTQSHWEHIYQTKSPLQTSWYASHLQTSLEWILQAAPDQGAAIIDVGGGESTLADDLLARGYRSITVLDISEAALAKSRRRMEGSGRDINWLVDDVIEAALPARAFDLWHDRAVFHFFTQPEQRAAYVRKLTASLKADGQVIMATFGPEGPQKCSGLSTVRYDADSLLRELGPDFRIVRQMTVEHQTPFDTVQQFLYCQFSFHGQG